MLYKKKARTLENVLEEHVLQSWSKKDIVKNDLMKKITYMDKYSK